MKQGKTPLTPAKRIELAIKALTASRPLNSKSRMRRRALRKTVLTVLNAGAPELMDERKLYDIAEDLDKRTLLQRHTTLQDQHVKISTALFTLLPYVVALSNLDKNVSMTRDPRDEVLVDIAEAARKVLAKIKPDD